MQRRAEPCDPWAFTDEDDAATATPSAPKAKPASAARATSVSAAADEAPAGAAEWSPPPPPPVGAAAPAPPRAVLAPPPPPPRESELIHLKLVELKDLCRARALAVSGACSQRPRTRSAPAWLTRCTLARAGTKAVLIGRLLGQAPVLPKPKPRKAAAASVPLFEDDDDEDDDAQAEEQDDDDSDDDFEASPPARTRCARCAHWLCAL
jgi:hypothetical protein